MTEFENEYIYIDRRQVYERTEEYELPKLIAEYLIPEEGVVDPPDPPPGGDIPYLEGNATIILKNAGSSDHPSGHEHDAYFVKVGRRVQLDIRYYFKADSEGNVDLGSGGDEFWIDVEGPEEIVPDFEVEGCLESVGVFHAWHGGMLEGNAYWSKNVGSGLDGIRVTYGGQHISKNYPYVWGASDHWRISIAYTV